MRHKDKAPHDLELKNLQMQKDRPLIVLLRRDMDKTQFLPHSLSL